MMPNISPDVFRGDLPNNYLLLYKNNSTVYQVSPSRERTQDIATCLSTLSTPNRAQSGTPSLWPATPPYWDAYPAIMSPPSLVVPSTSLSMANQQTVFSPSPLPVSQVPSLVFPEISPPSQGSGSTPFERQFVGDFSRESNSINTQISPVSRRIPHPSFFSSPMFPNAGGTPSGTDYAPSSQDSQDAVRVSLIDKFISAAADEFAITENDMPLSTVASPDCSSPLSDLTPLSSPESSDRFRHILDLRSSSPPTSPTVGRPKTLRRSTIQHTVNSGRDSPLNQSSRSPSRSRDSDYRPARGTTGCKRKRASRSRDGREVPTKRRKTRSADAPESTSADTSSSLESLTQRRLPTDIPYYPQFALLYLRFPVSSYLRLADGTFPLLSDDLKCPAGIYNEPRDALDLYAPRFVKGTGHTKVGVCPICIESPSRGGKGEAVWFSMKFSAYKVLSFIGKILNMDVCSYHMQYAHGISSTSARPFSPPVAFRTIKRLHSAKNERPSMLEGKCHKCKKWILVESIKNIDIKVKELYWWKHAAACHQGMNIDGDDDFFLDDDIYNRAQQLSAHDA